MAPSIFEHDECAPIMSLDEFRELQGAGVPGGGRVIVADVRWSLAGGSDLDAYREGHIPGAIFVDLERDLTGEDAPREGRHPFPRDDDFCETLGRLGIGFGDVVIAYGAGDPMPAARLVVMLRFVGVRAAILDGGLRAYVAGGGELENGERVLEPVEFPYQPFARLVGIDEVAHAGPTQGALLIDARAPERFRGEVEPLDPRPGHIPGAKNLPYTALLNPDGTFRSPAEIRALYEALGGSTHRITINYCGSGISAAVNTLAMDYAGLRQGYLYPGSYSEWSRDEARAVAVGE